MQHLRLLRLHYDNLDVLTYAGLAAHNIKHLLLSNLLGGMLHASGQSADKECCVEAKQNEKPSACPIRQVPDKKDMLKLDYVQLGTLPSLLASWGLLC